MLQIQMIGFFVMPFGKARENGYPTPTRIEIILLLIYFNTCEAIFQ